MRDYRFDVARVVCMTFIVVYLHLYSYIHPEVISASIIPACASLMDTCLGLFTFASGYLLGRKYCFGGNDGVGVWTFYKKRILRIIPLFLLAAFALWLIGFNNDEKTINGILCISPFVKVRPYTLWYIPVILYCYLITPLVARKSQAWRICCSLCIIGVLLVLERKVPTVDKRLMFNMTLFLIGIVSSTCFDWRMRFRKGTLVKAAIIILFLALLVFGHLHANFHSMWFRRCVAGIGVFALLFVCEFISRLLFQSDTPTISKARGSSFKSQLSRLIQYVSYASMAAYMFHRLFFWAGESIYNPDSNTVKWIYMSLVVFPVICVLSYWIQKAYDTLLGGKRK